MINSGKFQIVIGGVLLFMALSGFAQDKDLLSSSFPLEALKTIVVPRERWHPYPKADEREAWRDIPEAVRQAHIEKGKAALGYQWSALPASLFLEYARNGNRSEFEKKYFDRRHTLERLVTAECMEGQGRFTEDIVNGLWAICEESSWVLPAHVDKLQQAGVGLPDVAEPTVDIFSAETGVLLAWTIYLHGAALDSISPLVGERVRLELDKRILSPNLRRNDFWWMEAAMNWNTWICSNWLAIALLTEDDEDRRTATIHKIMKTLDAFLNEYPADGGCDEGPGYWDRAAGSLFDCLELLYSASQGKINFYDHDLIRNIGQFIYKAHISDQYFINFADASPQQRVPYYTVYQYGKRINDPLLSGFGAWAAERQKVGQGVISEKIDHQLNIFFAMEEILSAQGAVPLLRDVWLPDIQVMAARAQEGAAEGLYLAAKGGHNDESHNHNDVGNFMVYKDGQPVIIDVGVGEYTAKTFSDRRYEIWTMQSAYHNVPTINGVMQQDGRAFAAQDVIYTADASSASLTMDIAPAYPAEAGVNYWKRTLQLERGKQLVITENYALKGQRSEVTLTFMTPFEVDLSETGTLRLKQPSKREERGEDILQIHFDAQKLKAIVELLPLEDAKLQRYWGDTLYRILLKAEQPLIEDTWKITIE